MEWWVWVLIAVGVVLLGMLKLSVWKKIQARKASKHKFTDED